MTDNHTNPTLGRSEDHRDWWLWGTLVLISVWLILTAWWGYSLSKPHLAVKVSGVTGESYARLVVKTEEGWHEESPLWFPAYSLTNGEGVVSFRLRPGTYEGLRFALEKGTVDPAVSPLPPETGLNCPPLGEWRYSGSGPQVLDSAGELTDKRSRAVPTWEWEPVSPVVIQTLPWNAWGWQVLGSSALLLVGVALVSALFRGLLVLWERLGEGVKSSLDLTWERISLHSWLGVGGLLIWGLVLWQGTAWFQRNFGQEMYLRVEMSSSVESTAQVFFRNKEWFSQPKSALGRVVGSDLKQTIWFPLGRETVRSIRFDPLMRDGRVTLYAAHVVTTWGDHLYDVPLDNINFDDAQDIASHTYDPVTGALTVEVAEGSIDPNFILMPKGSLILRNTGMLEVAAVGVLWLVYLVFIIRVLVSRLCRKRVETSSKLQLLLSKQTCMFLFSAAATAILILPTVYFLKFFEGETSFIEMSATPDKDITGSWEFRSSRDLFLHHDYPFSLKAGERRTFQIALPRNKVHHYKLGFKGEDYDVTVKVDSIVFSVPSKDTKVDLLRNEEGFQWVNAPEHREEDGGWSIDIPAGEYIWFLLQDDSHILGVQPLWLQIGVLVILVVGCFVYLWKGIGWQSPTPGKLYLCLILGFGLMYCWVTPPYQTPDETRWLDRAWHLSEGHWFPEIHGDMAGGEVPTSFRKMYQKVSYDIAFNTHRRTNLERWKEANQVELNEDEVYIARMGDNTHSLLPYIPQSLGFRIGKALQLTPLEMTYVARMANLIIAALITYLAIRMLPVVPWTVLVLFLSPIMVFLYGSANHDPITNAFALLFIASVFFVRERAKQVRWWHCLLWIGLAVTLICSKFIYITLAGALLVLPRAQFRSAWDRWLKIGITWGVIVTLALSWLGMLSNYPPFDYDRPEVEQTMNKSILEQHPETVGEWLVNSYPFELERWLPQFVGVLGWLDTPLPDVIHLLWWVALAAAFLADMAAGRMWSPGIISRIWIVLLGLGTISMMFILFFLIYTQPGLERIQGIQGRYLLPLLPLFVAAVSFKVNWINRDWSNWLARFSVSAVFLVLFMTLVLLRFRYWDIY